MSVFICFTKLRIDQGEMIAKGVQKTFHVSIRNDNYKEEVKLTHKVSGSDPSHKTLPKNLFIIPQYEKLTIEVAEASTNEKNEKDRKFLLGEKEIYEWKLEGHQNSKVYDKKCAIKGDGWNFTFHYKVKYEKRAIFSGHFMNILNQELDECTTEDSCQSRGPKVFSIRDFPLRNTLEHHTEEDEDQQYKNELFDETSSHFDPPKYFHTKSTPPSIITTDQNGSRVCNCLHSNHQNGHSTTKESFCPEHTLIEIKEQVESNESPSARNSKKSKQKLLLVSRVDLYKGPCKSKNMFSCLDIPVEREELCIIEPHYTGSNRTTA